MFFIETLCMYGLVWSCMVLDGWLCVVVPYCPLHGLVRYGLLISCTFFCGPIGMYLYCQVWSLISLQSRFSCVVLCGHVWSSMVLCGLVQSGMFIYVFVWSYIVRYGTVWFCMLSYEFVWPTQLRTIRACWCHLHFWDNLFMGGCL